MLAMVSKTKLKVTDKKLLNRVTSLPKFNRKGETLMGEKIIAESHWSQLPKIDVSKNQLQLIQTSLKLTDIRDHYSIDHHDPKRKKVKGYQKLPRTNKIKELQNRIENNKVNFVQSVILSLRSPGATALEIMGESGMQIWLDKENLGRDLWIIDGQHRILAMLNLLKLYPDKYKDYKIPCNIVLNADRATETWMFYSINTFNNKPDTNLAHALITSDSRLNNQLSELEQLRHGWVPKVSKITKHLNENNFLWKDKIQMANAPKENALVTASSFHYSLKDIANKDFEYIPVKDQINIIENFWAALDALFGEAFSNPKDYTFQKSLGLSVLHEEILPQAMSFIRGKYSDKGLKKFQNFYEFLKPLLNYQDVDPNDNLVSGINFWKVGGGSGNYSGGAGKRILKNKLKNHFASVHYK